MVLHFNVVRVPFVLLLQVCGGGPGHALGANIPYCFAAVGTNTYGAGPWSLPTAVNVTQGTVPPGDAPVDGVQPLDGGAVVTWQPPSCDGGEPLVTYFPLVQNATTMLRLPPVPVNGSVTVYSTRVHGLANGHPYIVSVTAVNGANVFSSNCSESFCQQIVTPCGLPGVPAAPNVTAGDAVLAVGWAVPPNEPLGCPITAYTLFVQTAGDGSTVQNRTLTNNATGYTWTGGLQPGMQYQVAVAAANSVGGGAVSSWSSAVSTCGVPGAPGAVSAAALGNGSLIVRWGPPSCPPACPLTSYTVFASVACDGNHSATLSVSLWPNLTSHVWYGLSTGVAYAVSVSGNNSVGGGALSPWVNATTCAVPSIPAVPTVSGGDDVITVEWVAPPSHGCPIVGYIVYLRSGTNDTVAAPSNDTHFAWTSGLASGCTYQVAVAAGNAVGLSGASPWANVSTCSAPGPPALPILSGGDGALTVEWTFPNGSLAVACPVGAFQVGLAQVHPPQAHPVVRNHSAGSTHMRWPGLPPNTLYTARVRAVNGVGPGEWSPWSLPASTSKHLLPASVGVVATVAGLVVATFVLLKGIDCGFRCRRKLCCGVLLCGCVRLKRLPTLSPQSTAGLYAPLDSGESADPAAPPPIVQTQYTALFSVLLCLYRVGLAWVLPSLHYAHDTAMHPVLWIQLTTIVAALVIGVITAGRFFGSLVRGAALDLGGAWATAGVRVLLRAPVDTWRASFPLGLAAPLVQLSVPLFTPPPPSVDWVVVWRCGNMAVWLCGHVAACQCVGVAAFVGLCVWTGPYVQGRP
jgi:hypothetical protein